MPKYSTSGSSGRNDTVCELCGNQTDDLEQITVEGATLSVCPDCRKYGDDTDTQRTSTDTTTDTTTESTDHTQLQSGTSSLWDGDTEHWEKHGTDYSTDQLPYLADGYGDIVVEARRDAGMTRSELADAIDIDVETLDMVEQETAYTNNVSSTVISKLEAFLDIDIAEQR